MGHLISENLISIDKWIETNYGILHIYSKVFSVELKNSYTYLSICVTTGVDMITPTARVIRTMHRLNRCFSMNGKKLKGTYNDKEIVYIYSECSVDE